MSQFKDRVKSDLENLRELFLRLESNVERKFWSQVSCNRCGLQFGDQSKAIEIPVRIHEAGKIRSGTYFYCKNCLPKHDAEIIRDGKLGYYKETEMPNEE